ncbi:beta strand repeat-containing protein [Halorubrum yunnanense]|uniref:Beta strand repeat-containing protein n=1 Tax=Halorubrum yunnanense TaxID=1526162 RepID=A0ABD5YP73_9EURY|nr:surface glycoprotein [Halorubrum yunnanense]
MTDGNRRKKAQAVFFSLVMVLSMVGGTVAFAGSAAAATEASVTQDSSGPTYVAPGDTNVSVQAITVDGGSGDGTDLEINNFTVSNTGTADNNDITAIDIYEEDGSTGGFQSDEDTQVDGPVTTFGSAIGDNEQATNPVTTVADGTSQKFYVVVELAGDATDGNTLQTSTEVRTTTDSGTTFDSSAPDSVTVSAGSATTIDAGAPSLDDAKQTSRTTVDVNISDSRSGINKTTIDATDFSLSTGSVASIDKSGVTDGETGKQTVTLTLDSAINQATDVSINTSGGSIADKVGNELTSGDDAPVTAADTISPDISNVQLSNDESGNLVLTFESNEALDTDPADISVSVDAPLNNDEYTYEESDFRVSGSGPYTYTLDVTQPYDDSKGTYTATVDDAIDAADNNGGVNGDGSGLTDDYVLGNARAASISAQPNGDSQTSTHTAKVTLDSQTDVSVFEVDYSVTDFDGDITDATVESFGVDTTGNDEIDTSLTADQVSYADGSVLTVENTSGVTIDAGDQLILKYSGVTNPSSDTDVGLNLDPSTSDVAVTRTLSIGDTSPPTVQDVSISGTSVDDGEAYDESVNGTSLGFKVEFNKGLDTSTEPTVGFTVGGEAVELTNTNFEDEDATDDVYNGSVDINVDNAEASATVDVSGAVGTDGNTQDGTDSRTFEIDTASLGIVSAETAENADEDDADKVVVTLNDTYSSASDPDFSVTDDDDSNVPIDTVVTDTGDDTKLNLTFTSENSLAANATPNVTLETEGGIQDDAGNPVASSEKVEATDGVAPDITDFSHSVSGDQVTLTVAADEPLNTSAIEVELTNGDTTTVTDFDPTDSQNTYDATTTVDDADWTADLTQAEDEAGNDGADPVGTISPSVDTSGPSFELVTPADDPTTDKDNIDIEISDQTGVNTSSTYITVEDADGVVLDNARAAPTGSNIEIAQDADVDTDGDDPEDDLSIDNLDLADGQVNITVESDDTNGASNSTEFTYEVDTQVDSGEVVAPSDTVYKPTDGTLQVKYNYVDSNVDVVDIELNDVDGDENTVTYDINDGDYVDDGTNKTVTLDLANADSNEIVGDTDYRVDVTVDDSLGNDETYTTGDEDVVIDDTEPGTSDFSADDTTDPQTNFSFDIDEDDGTDSGVDASTIDLEVNQSDETLFEGTTADAAVSFDSGTLTFDTAEAGISYTDATPVHINVSVSDNVGNTLDTSDTDGPAHDFTVNDVDPVVDSVETEAGTDTVEVTFNEGVYANADGTGAVNATDFAYQSNNGGATAVDSVAHEAGDSVAVLTLDADVAASDIGSDLISVNQNEVYDANAVAVDHTATTALADTTDPATPGLSVEGNVTAGNQADYDVDVIAPNASVADVAVKNTSSGDIFAQQSKDVSSGSAQFTFDLTNIENGDVTIEANVTDLGVDLTSENKVTTVPKDNVSATIESVQTNAGTDELDVTFSEDVKNVDGNLDAFDGENLTIDSVSGSDATYTLTVDESIAPSDIDNESVTVSATAQVTDIVGTQADTSAVALEDGDDPAFDGVARASNGSTTVDVTFTESVYNNTDGALSAENFTYVNNSGVNHTVDAVEHSAGDTTATITLNSSLTPDDFLNDEIEATINDSVDNQTTDSALIVEFVSVYDFEATNTTDSTAEEIQIGFTSDAELDTFTVDVTTEHDLVETESNAVDVELNESGFEETALDDGTFEYETNFTVPRDGNYDADLTSATAVSGLDAHVDESDDDASVDYADPTPIDAELTGANEVTVQFNEPVSEVDDYDVENITADGHSANTVKDGEAQNELVFTFGDVVATGDEQNIAFGEDTLDEDYGDDTSVTGTSEKVDTHEFDLKEGANFVSVPAEFGSLDISESEFSDMSVMTYENGEWVSYAPDKTDDNQDFESMEGGQGYVVTADSDATVDVTVRNEEPGDTAEDSTPGQQQLQEGWNLVGHWQEGAQPADDGAGGALDSVGGDSSATYAYEQANDGEFSYAPVTADDMFEPGEAYWVFVEDDEIYTASNYLAE